MGFIAQDSIKIAVETKLTEDFDFAQLKNHLALFKAEQNKLLILLSPSLKETAAQQLALFRDEAMLQNIQVVHTSSEDVVGHCRKCLSPYDEEMLALVDDYESFCSGEGLLPRDQYTMYTVPSRFGTWPAGDLYLSRIGAGLGANGIGWDSLPIFAFVKSPCFCSFLVA